MPGTLLDRGARTAHQLGKVGVGRHPHADAEPARVVVRRVDDNPGENSEVGQDRELADAGAKCCGAQRDVLHGAGLIQDRDGVAEPERLLEEEPDPGEHVAQQVLEREADGDRADTGGGEDDRDVDAVRPRAR